MNSAFVANNDLDYAQQITVDFEKELMTMFSPLGDLTLNDNKKETFIPYSHLNEGIFV